MAGAAAATLGCEMTSENAGHVWQSSKTGVWVTLIAKHSITSELSMVCELRNKIKNVKAHLFLVYYAQASLLLFDNTKQCPPQGTVHLLFPCQG